MRTDELNRIGNELYDRMASHHLSFKEAQFVIWRIQEVLDTARHQLEAVKRDLASSEINLQHIITSK